MGSAEDATRSMIENLEAKTGKSLDQWVRLAKASGQDKHGKVLAFLKKEHGLTHGYANFVARTALAEPGATPLDLAASSPAGGEDPIVAAQYAGTKASLRPIYDALVAKLQAFGADVELAPKKTYVSVRRKKQFAILQPSTASRFDVGINLKGAPAKGRLEASGSFNAMVSHRVRVEKLADVDAELLRWLKQAYDAA